MAKAPSFPPTPPPRASPGSRLAHTACSVTAKFKNGDTVPFPNSTGLWASFQWVDDADVQSGDTLEWRIKGGKGDRPVLSPVTNQPVKVRFTIGNPVFQKGYFSGLHCVSEIAKQ